MKMTILLLTFTPIYCLAVEPMDNYYADDLIDAVNQAKERPHHYDYSSTYRYKRTTAQSIELNRLDLEELDETRLDMQQQSFNSKLNNLDSNVAAINNGHLVNQDPSDFQDMKINIQTLLPTNSQYQSNIGHYSSHDVISEGTLISTPRP